MRNIITSMRLISDVDWTELFERISLVDDVLAGAGTFPEMDFPTRNLYRSAIEELARGSDRTEIEVARRAVLAADQAQTDARALMEDRQSDPGYHLLAGGRPAFEAAIGFRPPPRTWLGRASRALGIGGYVGAVAIVAALSSPCHCSRSPPLGWMGHGSGCSLALVPSPPSTRPSRW